MHDLEARAKVPAVEVERRHSERVLYCNLKINYDGRTGAVDARSPDLTPDGMFINTPRTLEEGAKLELRFDLLRTGVMVHVCGQVRYCLRGVGAGVRFIGLPEYARAAIKKELEEVKKSEAGS